MGANDDDGPNSEVASAELRSAASRIIKRCGLRGAQLGLTMVFLKYYHGELLMSLIEKQDRSATVLTKHVRRFLATCQLKHLKEAKAKEEARRAREEACTLARDCDYTNTPLFNSHPSPFFLPQCA